MSARRLTRRGGLRDGAGTREQHDEVSNAGKRAGRVLSPQRWPGLTQRLQARAVVRPAVPSRVSLSPPAQTFWTIATGEEEGGCCRHLADEDQERPNPQSTGRPPMESC